MELSNPFRIKKIETKEEINFLDGTKCHCIRSDNHKSVRIDRLIATDEYHEGRARNDA